MSKLDKVVKDLQQIRLIIQLRNADANTKLTLMRSVKMEELKEVAESYFMMDCVDLATLEKSYYKKYYELIEVSMELDGVKSSISR